MAIITVPNPRALGVAPDGMYMWRYHTRDVENDVLVCRYAVAHRCPPVSAPMTWFETEEAARMSWEMSDKTRRWPGLLSQSFGFTDWRGLFGGPSV